MYFTFALLLISFLVDHHRNVVVPQQTANHRPRLTGGRRHRGGASRPGSAGDEPTYLRTFRGTITGIISITHISTMDTVEDMPMLHPSVVDGCDQGLGE